MTDSKYDGTFHEAVGALLDTLDPEQRKHAELLGAMNSSYIGTFRDRKLDAAFDEIVVNAAAAMFGNAGKRRALFVVGETGSGKTTSVLKHIAKRKAFQERTTPDGQKVTPLCWFEAPKPLTLKHLAHEGLNKLGYQVLNPRISGPELFSIWKDQLREQRILFLAIDEVQHVLRGDTVKELQTVADVLKSLTQIPGWPLHLILSGVPDLVQFIHQPGKSEGELKERSLIVEFRRMTFPEDIPVMTRVVEKIITVEAQLKPGAGVLTEEFIHRLLHASNGGFGSMIQTTRRTCGNVRQRDGDTVDVADFAAAYALESGCRPPQNIFTAGENWLDILPSNSLQEMLDEQKKSPRSSKKGA